MLIETLVLDAESGTMEEDLRKDIEDSLWEIECLNLVCREEVTLKVGDEFDLIPVDGGVIVKKKDEADHPNPRLPG